MHWLVLLTPLATAGEGMWLPEQVPDVAPAFADKGLVLDPATLADPLGDPLGAIISLGGCSASFVSETGLIATNYHCVEGYLQYNATAEAPLQVEGYAAGSQQEELSVGPTGRVRIVEKITNVTDQVMARVSPRLKGKKRRDRLAANQKALVASCEEQDNRRCYVASYYGGREYRLVQSLELQDLRLVYAPHQGVGQFGGEIDNWMWPRHTADFAFLRAYTAPDGSSAPYAEDNIPYVPAHHLVPNPEGADPGEFVMVAGFPGRTQRHQLAEQVAFRIEEQIPRSIAARQAKMAILQKHADADPAAAAVLSAPIGYLANYEKNFRGLLEGFERHDLMSRKRAEQDALLVWVEKNPTRAQKWGRAMSDLRADVAAEQQESLRAMRLGEVAGNDLLSVAYTAVRWAEERTKKKDLDRESGYQDRDRDRIEGRFDRLDRTYHAPSEKELLRWALDEHAKAPAAEQVPALTSWIEAHGGIEAAVEELFAAQTLTTAEGRKALLDKNVTELEAMDDPWLDLALHLEREFYAAEREQAHERSGDRSRLWPAWYEALEAWHAEKGEPLYPDANSSLRLTLGVVKGYSPQDGLLALPQTTLSGMAQKATGAFPFNAPEAIVEAAQDGQNSRWYSEELGDVPVNSLSTLDITGGNSGSAVMDGKGQWVGLAFDGNYESIASDWVWLDDVTRCIQVDLRYILWVLDHEPKAGWLLEELGAAPAAAE